MSIRFHISTFGCQMNDYDSAKIAQILAPMGYEQADDPSDADLLLINTCSIREKAERKVYSLLGRFKGLKRRNPSLIIGVGGCVAQQEGEALLHKVDCLDFVFGTHAIFDLPEILSEVGKNGRRKAYTDFTYRFDPPMESAALETAPAKDPSVKSLVTIMRGCDNFCTFCVVPYTRGHEVSRPSGHILEEAAGLARAGAKEITLLGQNVNSYRSDEGKTGFVDLLQHVNRIRELERIRFTTSHPKDLSSELIHAFGSLEKLCPHIHLPVQSGSDAILKRMNRRYTRNEYLEKIQRLRSVCPDISITTDLIVGFPGETDHDFEATLELMRRVRFDGAYSFKYSDRPPAKATRFEGKVPEELKSERLQRLQALQNRITLERNQRFTHRDVRVLVECQGRRRPSQVSGRTGGNQVVNFPGDRSLTGRIVSVRVEEALLHSLRGRLQSSG